MDLPCGQHNREPARPADAPPAAGFSTHERQLLLVTAGIGPAVVERLEEAGIGTLAQLRALGGEEAARAVSRQLGAPGWANRGRALARALALLSISQPVRAA